VQYHPILSTALLRKQLSSHRAPRGNCRYREEPAVFLPSAVRRSDFWAIFMTKCQFRMEKGKHKTSNGVSSHVPSRRAKLATLRRRLLRFPQVGKTLKKLFSPTLEKALTFLDDKLLPSTSNAVERGNRRYRKMQKSVYRVRTQAQIRARLALDMWREAQAEGRQQTLAALHQARAG